MVMARWNPVAPILPTMVLLLLVQQAQVDKALVQEILTQQVLA